MFSQLLNSRTESRYRSEKNNDMGDVVRQKYKLYLTNKKDKGRIKNDDKYVVCPAVCGLRLPADDDFMLKKERVVLC